MFDSGGSGREPASIGSTGFGAEVREAMNARFEHLVREGLANRQGQRFGVRPGPSRNAMLNNF